MEENGKAHLMRFLDVTDSEKSLETLAVTLLFVDMGLLILFYIAIVYFSNRAIERMMQ